MRIITTVSTKGGSGKTTLTQLLASAAIDRGKTVRLFDADADPRLGKEGQERGLRCRGTAALARDA